MRNSLSLFLTTIFLSQAMAFAPPQHIIPQAGSPADTPPYRDPYDSTISENAIYQFLFATLADMESPIGRTEERRLSYRKKIRDIVQLSDTEPSPNSPKLNFIKIFSMQ